jgi:hypothetical protein
MRLDGRGPLYSLAHGDGQFCEIGEGGNSPVCGRAWTFFFLSSFSFYFQLWIRTGSEFDAGLFFLLGFEMEMKTRVLSLSLSLFLQQPSISCHGEPPCFCYCKIPARWRRKGQSEKGGEGQDLISVLSFIIHHHRQASKFLVLLPPFSSFVPWLAE